MVKKVIISILSLLILVSLGIIGYIITSQNPDFTKILNLSFLTRSKETTELKVPKNFFPQATNVSESGQNPLVTEIPEENASTKETRGGESLDLSLTSAIGLVKLNNDKETILFVDKTNGNIYEITEQNNLVRLTNETILGIGEIYWGKDRLIFRTSSPEGIRNISGSIKYSTNNTDLDKLSTQTLNSNIIDLAISPSQTNFFTLEAVTDGVIGYLNDWNGKVKIKKWSFPLKEWQISWPKENLIGLTTKPSALNQGFLYFLNPSTGSFVKILKGINGLTTNISPDGQKLIFSRSNLGRFQLFLYDVASKKTEGLGINTLPEKCTWLDNNLLFCAVPRSIPQGNYPDNWYQGKITFTDDIWKINISQKTASLALSLNGNYDLINMVITPKRGWIFALNKTNGSLQSFSLPAE